MHHWSRKSPIAAAVLAVLAAVMVLGIAACGASSVSTTSGHITAGSAGGAKTLTVSAASSLKNAFTEIGAGFDAANGSTTTFNFDASGTLQKQIEGGAPVDVFASAGLKQIEALQDAGLVDAASVRDFAANQIVLVVPASSTLDMKGFQDLAKAEVKKVGYGDPRVAPNGVAAEQILTALGIFDQVKPKVVYAQNVAQATQYVTSGEVEAGILFATEAKAAGDKVKIVATADPSWYGNVAYPIAVVSASRAKDLGRMFIDYVLGADGQAILAKYGFLPATTS